MEQQIEKLMKALDISRAEAIQVIEDDRRIDKGEKLFELTDEQKKASKKARQADRKPTVYNFKQKKEKPVNDEKTAIIQAFINSLENAENVEVQNAEREFTFTMGETKYKVVLSCPRK